jgi:uncharacterized protein YndB with AHSA1/START domain
MPPAANTLRHDITLPRPPSDVWAALTQPALMSLWWAPGDVQPVVGHRFTLDMGSWGQQACQVMTVDPHRLFRYTFALGQLDTTISWQLAPEGAGTHVAFEQSGFDLQSEMGRTAFEGMGAGWPRVLQRLQQLLAAAK